MCRKSLILLSLLLLSCYSVFALAPLKKATAVEAPTVSTDSTTLSTTEQKATTTESTKSLTVSESSEKAVSKAKDAEKVEDVTETVEVKATVDYEALLASFENKGYFVTKGTLNELQEGVKSLYQDYLEKAALADTYKEEAKAEAVKTKFFADLGLAFGFENKALMYGFAGDIGMKLGHGLMLKGGATYMVGSLADIKNISLGLDKLTVSATVGWEW